LRYSYEFRSKSGLHAMTVQAEWRILRYAASASAAFRHAGRSTLTETACTIIPLNPPFRPAAASHSDWPGQLSRLLSIVPDATGLSALEHFILAARKTPRWIEICMRARNLVGGLVGLKNLGTLSALKPGKPAASYGPGDRVGIFSGVREHL
jgi:hypothetical protein